jgi:deoxycytidine triphosphate deaminase
MFISPLTIIKNGWIKFPEWMTEQQRQKCIQPNAIDITLDRVFVPDYSVASYKYGDNGVKPISGLFMLNDTTGIKQTIPQKEISEDEDGMFKLPQTSFVDVMSDFHVNVPAGFVASFIVRSTLNRNGLFITNGLYDQGFNNYMGFVLHNRALTDAYIGKHTRVGQIYFVKAEDSGMMYDGQYNQNKGVHWTRNVSETSKELEKTHQIDSLQESKPAGTRNFL